MELLPPGSLLISQAEMNDPNFEGSVVLLCRHDEEGALGLTLNRPLDVQLGPLLADEPELCELENPICWGGPVGLERLHLLHGAPDPEGLCFPVAEGLRFGGDLAMVRRLHERGTRMRFFLGYSGWGEGQLESELEADAWLTLPPDPEARWPEVWERPAQGQWERLVGILDPRYRWLRQVPDDPRAN